MPNNQCHQIYLVAIMITKSYLHLLATTTIKNKISGSKDYKQNISSKLQSKPSFSSFLNLEFIAHWFSKMLD